MSFDFSTLDRPFTEPGASLEASLPEGMTAGEYVELKARLHERLVKEMDPNGLTGLTRDEIDRRVAPLGRRIDESSPMVDARLPDGSRVNAIIPPLAIKGPTVTIRKFAKVPYKVEDLVNFGTLTDGMADFLHACVLARLNIMVS